MFRSSKILRKLFPQRIWGISVSDQSIFLTFDDGPNPAVTPWVLDFLKSHNIQATFFCVGENVVKHPNIYARIVAEGHQVGNHTMKHLNGMKVAKKDYLNSIEDASQHIHSSLFRPPYGRLSRRLDNQISLTYQIVMWSWLSKDYDENIPTESIIEAATKIQSGDVLVFHDNQKTVERLQQILPTVVDNLLKAGFHFRLIPTK